MSSIKVLHEMDWPKYSAAGAITVMKMVTVQVDDELPVTVQVPKDGYTDQALRDAVKTAMADRAAQAKAGGARTIQL